MHSLTQALDGCAISGEAIAFWDAIGFRTVAVSNRMHASETRALRDTLFPVKAGYLREDRVVCSVSTASASSEFPSLMALGSAFVLHGPNVAPALLHYERVRHYRATRFQLGSKFAFDHLRAKDTSAQKALLEKLNERVSPAFAHDKYLRRDSDHGTFVAPPRPTMPRSRSRIGGIATPSIRFLRCIDSFLAGNGTLPRSSGSRAAHAIP